MREDCDRVCRAQRRWLSAPTGPTGAMPSASWPRNCAYSVVWCGAVVRAGCPRRGNRRDERQSTATITSSGPRRVHGQRRRSVNGRRSAIAGRRRRYGRQARTRDVGSRSASAVLAHVLQCLLAARSSRLPTSIGARTAISEQADDRPTLCESAVPVNARSACSPPPEESEPPGRDHVHCPMSSSWCRRTSVSGDPGRTFPPTSRAVVSPAVRGGRGRPTGRGRGLSPAWWS